MKPWKAGLFVGGVVALCAAPSFAYVFDDMCAPQTTHSPTTGAPDVLMVVDRSLSMHNNTVPPTSMTRWEVAVAAIDEATTDLEVMGTCAMPGDPGCEPVRFGLGWFSSDERSSSYCSTYPGRCDPGDSDLVIEPDHDTASAINTWLADSDNGPNGGTETELAIDVMLSSTSLAEPDRPAAGVLITDGTPNWEENAEAAAEKICDLRFRDPGPANTYVVGFGADSNQPVNSFLAAAGGTGTCCVGTSYPCDEADQVDPCDLSSSELDDAIDDDGSKFSTEIDSDYDCGGSIEATDGSAFKAALLDIAAEVACTFPLEIPMGYPAGDGADEDPDATAVEIDHALFGSDFPIPYCEETDMDCGLESTLTGLGVDPMDAADYADEGWYFADASRRFVRVSPKLCDDIQAEDVTEVRTQVACLCTKTGPCDFTNVMVPDGMGGMRPANATELDNMRCSEGEWQCVGGIDTCVSTTSQMPEICNGIDDDCDGLVDNMSDSWEKPAFSGFSLPMDHQGIDCNRNDVCMCPDGMADPVGGTDEDSFYDSWTGNCQCVEGLDEAEPASYGEPMRMDDDPQAACSTGPGAGASGLALLLIGLFARVRRRR
jgi:MYXO-CTERM domain-containing protein